jgi:hypothetical protein
VLFLFDDRSSFFCLGHDPVKGIKAVSGADGVEPIFSVFYSIEDDKEKLSLAKILLTLSTDCKSHSHSHSHSFFSILSDVSNKSGCVISFDDVDIFDYDITAELKEEIRESGGIAAIVEVLDTAQNEDLLLTLTFTLRNLSENRTYTKNTRMSENKITI